MHILSAEMADYSLQWWDFADISRDMQLDPPAYLQTLLRRAAYFDPCSLSLTAFLAVGLSVKTEELAALELALQAKPLLAYALNQLGKEEAGIYIRQNVASLEIELDQLRQEVLGSAPKHLLCRIPGTWRERRPDEIALVALASFFGRPLLRIKEDWSPESSLPVFSQALTGPTVAFYKTDRVSLIFELSWPFTECLSRTSLALTIGSQELLNWRIGISAEITEYLQFKVDRCKRQKQTLEPVLGQLSSVTQEILTINLDITQCPHKRAIVQHSCGQWLCYQCVFPQSSWTPTISPPCPNCKFPLLLKDVESLMTKHGFVGTLNSGWFFCCKCQAYGLEDKITQLECGHTACLNCVLESCELGLSACGLCDSYPSRELLKGIKSHCDKCKRLLSGNKFPPLRCQGKIACWNCFVSPAYCPHDGHELQPDQQQFMIKAFFTCVSCGKMLNKSQGMNELTCLCAICQDCGLRAMAAKRNSTQCSICSAPVKVMYLHKLELEIAQFPSPQPRAELPLPAEDKALLP